MAAPWDLSTHHLLEPIYRGAAPVGIQGGKMSSWGPVFKHPL